MRLLLGLMLLSTLLPGADFVEVRVDASAADGVIGELFGIEAPADPRQAKLLLESELQLPVLAGPEAAMRAELLAALPGARPADPAHPAHVWTMKQPDDASVEAADAVAFAIGLAVRPAPAAYYKRQSGAWFGDDGPVPVLEALALASRLSETPQRRKLRSENPTLTGLAGVAADGETVQILLVRRMSDADPSPPSFVAYVENLPWGKSEFAIERHRLGGEVRKGSGRSGMARISAPFPAPGIELIVLRKQQAAPGAGVLRRRTR